MPWLKAKGRYIVSEVQGPYWHKLLPSAAQYCHKAQRTFVPLQHDGQCQQWLELSGSPLNWTHVALCCQTGLYTFLFMLGHVFFLLFLKGSVHFHYSTKKKEDTKATQSLISVQSVGHFLQNGIGQRAIISLISVELNWRLLIISLLCSLWQILIFQWNWKAFRPDLCTLSTTYKKMHFKEAFTCYSL